MSLLSSDYHFELPEELIAQTPPVVRGNSRLLVGNSKTDEISHHVFSELPKFLKAGDVLVLNNTKVIHARVFAKKTTGGSCELFFLNQTPDGLWEALVKPARRIHENEVLTVGLENKLVIRQKNGNVVKVECLTQKPFLDFLDEHGHIPLPPYVTHFKNPTSTDNERYQTVYASEPGAVAAPTAGLHFNEALLTQLKAMGVSCETITLHVGLGTFKPMKSQSILDHEMHYETYHIEPATAAALNQALREKRRIIAVGTTVVRTLESAYQNGTIQAGTQRTNMFIYPGFVFNVVQGLITNFHLPQSTLLVLVSAFSGKTFIDKLYTQAIKLKYRFFSFGDAMLLLN